MIGHGRGDPEWKVNCEKVARDGDATKGNLVDIPERGGAGMATEGAQRHRPLGRVEMPFLFDLGVGPGNRLAGEGDALGQSLDASAGLAGGDGP